jgi:hypothetical protein
LHWFQPLLFICCRDFSSFFAHMFSGKEQWKT